MRDAIGFAAVLVACVLLGAASSVGAPFEPGQLIVANGNHLQVLGISVPGSPTEVADLSDTLPAGWSMFNPYFMVLGPDGELYNITGVDKGDGAGHREGVLQWGAAGYAAFYEIDLTYDGPEGFAVAANGNFLVGDRDRPKADPADPALPYIREYDRNVSGAGSYATLDFTSPDVQGDDGLVRRGDRLYATGIAYVAIYEIIAGASVPDPTWTQTDAIGDPVLYTGYDNDITAAAYDGRFAVNDQWWRVDNERPAWVKVYDADGSPITTVELPGDFSGADPANHTGWSARCIDFDPDGHLYVLGRQFDADQTMIGGPTIYVYDTNYDLVDTIDLSSQWPETHSFLITPEPATLALLVLGGAGVLIRRRRS